MKKLIAFCVAAMLSSTPAAAEPVSVYTKLQLEDGCIVLGKYEQGGTWNCPGYGGYGVYFSEGDLRQSVYYGHLGAWLDDRSFESFGGFNNISGTFEWRLVEKSGPPFATIARWFIDGVEGSKRQQVLVVSKVGQPGIGEACVVGYVDALSNKNANVLAREVADTLAVDFACRVDEPQWHGKTSDSTPSVMR